MMARQRWAICVSVPFLAIGACSPRPESAISPSPKQTPPSEPTPMHTETMSNTVPVPQLRPALLRDGDAPGLHGANQGALRFAPCAGAVEPARPPRSTRVTRAFSDRAATGVLLEQLTDLPTRVGDPANEASMTYMRQVRRTWDSRLARTGSHEKVQLSNPGSPSSAEDSYAVEVRSPGGAVCEVVWLKQGDFVIRLDIGGALQRPGAAQRYSDLAITALKRALA